MLRPLYLWGKNSRYSLNRRLSGPQSRFGRRGEVKILVPTGNPTPIPCSPSRSLLPYRVHSLGPFNIILIFIFESCILLRLLLQYFWVPSIVTVLFECFFVFPYYYYFISSVITICNSNNKKLSRSAVAINRTQKDCP
jgi:hypothetical protein